MKVHTSKVLKAERKLNNEKEGWKKGEKVNSVQCQNVQKFKRAVFSESCSTFAKSSLSVMQHKHVRLQRHPMQTTNQSELSQCGNPVQRMPHTH